MHTETRGQYIRRKREEKGLIQKDLSAIVGVSITTIRKWEADEVYNIKTDYITKLAEALGVSEKEIRLGQDISIPDPALDEVITKHLRKTDESMILMEERIILMLDIAIVAFGASFVSLSISMWVGLANSLFTKIVCVFLGILGIVVIIMGRRLIIKMEKKLSERKEEASV